MDGASSVSEHEYIDPALGDPAWFVQNLSHHLSDIIPEKRSVEETVRQAIFLLAEEFNRTRSVDSIPLYALPIAAVTWCRIFPHEEDKSRIDIYALGDCKTLIKVNGLVQDADPFTNHQDEILSGLMCKWRGENYNEIQIREKLLPVLRKRREEQNQSATPSVLCLKPGGDFVWRKSSYPMSSDSAVLIMSDGFYRLVSPYRTFTETGLLEHCSAHGLEAAYKDLRSHEHGQGYDGRDVIKKADDASAVLWSPGSP